MFVWQWLLILAMICSSVTTGLHTRYVIVAISQPATNYLSTIIEYCWPQCWCTHTDQRLETTEHSQAGREIKIHILMSTKSSSAYISALVKFEAILNYLNGIQRKVEFCVWIANYFNLFYHLEKMIKMQFIWFVPGWSILVMLICLMLDRLSMLHNNCFYQETTWTQFLVLQLNMSLYGAETGINNLSSTGESFHFHSSCWNWTKKNCHWSQPRLRAFKLIHIISTMRPVLQQHLTFPSITFRTWTVRLWEPIFVSDQAARLPSFSDYDFI